MVLRQFVENVQPGGRQLARFDLAAGQRGLIGTNGIGYVNDFVPIDSQATEDLWQTVEGQLRPAIDAALNGTALANPAHLSTLRGAVALHFVRNPQTLTIHNQSFANAADKAIDQLAKTTLAAESFRRQHGLWDAPRLPDSPSIRMDVWKGEVIASTEEELLTGIQG